MTEAEFFYSPLSLLVCGVRGRTGTGLIERLLVSIGEVCGAIPATEHDRAFRLYGLLTRLSTENSCGPLLRRIAGERATPVLTGVMRDDHCHDCLVLSGGQGSRAVIVRAWNENDKTKLIASTIYEDGPARPPSIGAAYSNESC
ncbi:hypothetical protein GFY24_39785 [Nocardia sp. SYP-A9097]|uniref:hypothetical protein n=1 Tax=Nocardia sp. SYP-A9097 TaxID=2663237 RepID=UPI00129AC32B|nr:hypothetical protein [Nocardia sp. SYP-A9097]MRH93481.1 hypothetical protein [Nocardia sp. SYP-A9097]